MDNSTQKTTLYRYFNSEGELLYVGITGDNTKRQSQHRRNSFWFGEIASATFEHYDERKEALEAESAAIIQENPKHNIVRGNTIRITHSPYMHMVYLAGMPEGGHDELHREFVKHYHELFQVANPHLISPEAVIVFAMHFTYCDKPDLPNFTRCDKCKEFMESEWFEKGFRDMKKGKK